MTADIVALQRQLDDQDLRLRRIENAERPNQATDLTSSPTFAGLTVNGDVAATGKIETSRGTFTPAYTGSGTAGVFTYATQTGLYTKVGSLVYFTARLQISAIGTPPVGNMRITGLPFTCESTADHAVNFAFISNFNYTNTAFQLTGGVTASQTYVALYESFDNAGVGFVPAANFTNASCDLMLNGIYRV